MPHQPCISSVAWPNPYHQWEFQPKQTTRSFSKQLSFDVSVLMYIHSTICVQYRSPEQPENRILLSPEYCVGSFNYSEVTDQPWIEEQTGSGRKRELAAPHSLVWPSAAASWQTPAAPAASSLSPVPLHLATHVCGLALPQILKTPQCLGAASLVKNEKNLDNLPVPISGGSGMPNPKIW